MLELVTRMGEVRYGKVVHGDGLLCDAMLPPRLISCSFPMLFSAMRPERMGEDAIQMLCTSLYTAILETTDSLSSTHTGQERVSTKSWMQSYYTAQNDVRSLPSQFRPAAGTRAKFIMGPSAMLI